MVLNLATLLSQGWHFGAQEVALKFVPFLLFLELPLQLTLMLGILKWAYEEHYRKPKTISPSE